METFGVKPNTSNSNGTTRIYVKCVDIVDCAYPENIGITAAVDWDTSLAPLPEFGSQFIVRHCTGNAHLGTYARINVTEHRSRRVWAHRTITPRPARKRASNNAAQPVNPPIQPVNLPVQLHIGSANRISARLSN